MRPASDRTCPFMTDTTLALVEGRGERVSPMAWVGEAGVLTVTPPIELVTGRVFARYDDLGSEPSADFRSRPVGVRNCCRRSEPVARFERPVACGRIHRPGSRGPARLTRGQHPTAVADVRVRPNVVCDLSCGRRGDSGRRSDRQPSDGSPRRPYQCGRFDRPRPSLEVSVSLKEVSRCTRRNDRDRSV